MMRTMAAALMIFGAYAYGDDGVDTSTSSVVARLQGIALSTETGASKDETSVSASFVFLPLPTSYYYEVNLKERTVCFEFNDAGGDFSAGSVELVPPMTRVTYNTERVDINKGVKGQPPEFHEKASVCFYFDKVPIVAASNENSMISFSYRWSSDSLKTRDYQIVESGYWLNAKWWFVIDKVLWAAIVAGLIVFARSQ